jgi:hypothetical protein
MGDDEVEEEVIVSTIRSADDRNRGIAIARKSSGLPALKLSFGRKNPPLALRIATNPSPVLENLATSPVFTQQTESNKEVPDGGEYETLK